LAYDGIDTAFTWFGYGLTRGHREMAVGNTFGATALSSYGGFWISYAILLTPAWGITAPNGPYEGDAFSPIGFFLTGWFIFTTILLLCTLRSTLAFFLLFFTLDLAFLFLACEQYAGDMGNMAAKTGLQKAGGFFGFLAAFLAWYNALAGIQDSGYVFQPHLSSSSQNLWLTHLAVTLSSRFPSSTSRGPTRAWRGASPSPNATRLNCAVRR
jgi:succinate-acetate transporter protein